MPVTVAATDVASESGEWPAAAAAAAARPGTLVTADSVVTVTHWH